MPLAKVSKKAMSAEEARRLLGKRMQAGTFLRDFELVRIVEAVVGPELVVDEIVKGLDAYREKEIRGWNRASVMLTRWLALGLLRCRASFAAKQRKKLQKIYERWLPMAPPGTQLIGVLDVAIHGGEGARRSGYRHEGAISSFDLHGVDDEPHLVVEQVKRAALGPMFVPDARLAFLGGERLIAYYTRSWNKIRNNSDLLSTLDHFGRIRSKHVVKMMREVAERSTHAKDVAAAWLAAHADVH